MDKHKGLQRLSLLVIMQVVSCLSLAASPQENDARAAQAAHEKGHYRQAIVHYQQVLQYSPDDAAVRMKLAESYELSGNLALAEEHAATVLQSSPTNTDGLLMMGRIRARTGDWAGSKSYHERAIAADDNNAAAYLGLGQALMQLDENASADAAFAQYRRLSDIAAP